MLHVKKLSGFRDSNNPLFAIDQNGVAYRRKLKSNPMTMLADVFFSKFAHMMGCNAAENDLVEFERAFLPYENRPCYEEIKQMVFSKNFLKKEEIHLNLSDFLNLGPKSTDIFFSEKSSIFQNINLRKFFHRYLNEMPSDFKEALIKEWWLRTYFRDADQYYAHNVGVVYKNSQRNIKEAKIAPSYDFEYCMLSEPKKMNLQESAKRYVKIMNRGLHPVNVDFLKNEYRDLSEKFLSSVEAVKQKPELDALCKFSHLARFFTEVAEHHDHRIKNKKEKYEKVLSKKLTEVSGDVRKNCLKRGELLLSQWR